MRKSFGKMSSSIVRIDEYVGERCGCVTHVLSPRQQSPAAVRDEVVDCSSFPLSLTPPARVTRIHRGVIRLVIDD